MEWWKKIDIDDLDEQYQDIAEDIGIENFIKIVKKFGGTSLYIPKTKTIYNEVIKKTILKEYNGCNKKKLAIKYDLSERTIQNIISENKYFKQINLFRN